MIKIFISQPMEGKTKQQIDSDMDTIINMISAKNLFNGDYVIINDVSDAEKYNYSNELSLKSLVDSLKIMSEADYVLFINGYDKARGCLIEHECAVKYGLNIMYYLNDIDFFFYKEGVFYIKNSIS